MKHQSFRASHLQRRQSLRGNSTDAERITWQHLRGKQVLGVRFRRQHSIDQYIVDFVSLEAKLIVELDGGQHAENVPYDTRRDHHSQSLGFTVLRFWNNDVIENPSGFLKSIHLTVANHLLKLDAIKP